MPSFGIGFKPGKMKPLKLTKASPINLTGKIKIQRERVPAKIKNQIKDKIKKKYGRLVCEKCKIKPREVTLQYHHINMKPNDNRLSNIRVLCPNHHTREHKKKYRKKYKNVFGVETHTRLVKKKPKTRTSKSNTSFGMSNSWGKSLFKMPKIGY